jgi:hypothetical protein
VLLGDLSGNVFGVLGRVVDDGNVAASLGDGLGDGTADTAVTAGNDGGGVGKVDCDVSKCLSRGERGLGGGTRVRRAALKGTCVQDDQRSEQVLLDSYGGDRLTRDGHFGKSVVWCDKQQSFSDVGVCEEERAALHSLGNLYTSLRDLASSPR